MNINAGKRLVSLDENEDQKYMGYYLNGQRDGDGLLIDFKKDYFYDGAWKSNKMHGFGKLKLGFKQKGSPQISQKMNEMYHEGYFKNNFYDGPGIQMDIDGNIFNGTFLNNKKTGCGSFQKSDGTIERGHWRENIRQGLFKITYSNDVEFCVNYVNGKEDGIPRDGDCTKVECL